jgi:hypothetical protein
VSQQVQLMQKNTDTVNIVAQSTQVTAGRTLQPPQYYTVAAGGVPQPQQAGGAPVTFDASTGGFSSAQYAQLMTSLQGFDPNRPQEVPINQGVAVTAPNQKSTNTQTSTQQKQQQPTPVLIQPALSSIHKQSPLATLSVELNGDHLDLGKSLVSRSSTCHLCTFAHSVFYLLFYSPLLPKIQTLSSQIIEDKLFV